MKTRWITAIALAVSACADPSAPGGGARLVPLIAAEGSLQARVVPNEYLIVMDDAASVASRNDAEATARGAGGVVTARWDRALNGFAARLPAGALLAMRQRPDVKLIEPDGLTAALGTQSPVGSWGQDRIDQRTLPVDNSYTYPNTATGVQAYILDTGILTTHAEFTGRVGAGASFDGSGNVTDGNGHGTHIAGTLGGTTYGVAKNVTLHPVKVLNATGSGQWSWYISGINWIMGNKGAHGTQWVANASLGGSLNASADAATDNLVASGVTLAVPSGGSASDACSFTPANRGVTDGVVTVNASTETDARASFSNFGTCTDIFAPGTNIVSAWIGSNTATATLSGTSMSAPHVAGAAAMYLAANAGWSPAQVESQMRVDATMNAIANPGAGSPNRLLFVGNIGGGPGNQPPVASFTHSCVPRLGGGFTCTFDGSASSDPDGSVVAWNWSSPGRANKSGVTVSYPFPVAGTYAVTLTVTDNVGATHSIVQNIVVGGGPVNQPPVAAFTYSCAPRPTGGFSCAFDGSSSSDPDGSVVAWTWSSPGRANKSGVTASYPFPTAGTYSVTLVVTDNQGATNSITRSITVQ